MSKYERIPIERREGVTIYGRVIGENGRLGRYEVFSDIAGSDGVVYHEYAHAEVKMKKLIGVSKHKPEDYERQKSNGGRKKNS